MGGGGLGGGNGSELDKGGNKWMWGIVYVRHRRKENYEVMGKRTESQQR